MDGLVTALKALGHADRLRILALLSHGELTVSELVRIMDVSQPRVTQYIKALELAGIVERQREGSWVFSRLSRGREGLLAVVASALAALPEDDARVAADRERLEGVRAARAEEAARFFADVANDRERLGDEYLPQRDIEAAMRLAVGGGPYRTLVDLGTGTGRVLGLLADRVERGVGLDLSPDMLRVARHRLSGRGHLSVRQGDLRDTAMEAGAADLVTLHQVLHFLEEPEEAVREAARLLAPGGAVLVVDFAAHGREEFRDRFNHRRLGFADGEIEAMMARAGLRVARVDTVAGTDGSEGRPDVKLWLGRRAEVRRQA